MTRRIPVGPTRVLKAARLLQEAGISGREDGDAVVVNEPDYLRAKSALRELVKAHSSEFALFFTPDIKEAN